MVRSGVPGAGKGIFQRWYERAFALDEFSDQRVGLAQAVGDGQFLAMMKKQSVDFTGYWQRHTAAS